VSSSRASNRGNSTANPLVIPCSHVHDVGTFDARPYIYTSLAELQSTSWQLSDKRLIILAIDLEIFPMLSGRLKSDIAEHLRISITCCDPFVRRLCSRGNCHSSLPRTAMKAKILFATCWASAKMIARWLSTPGAVPPFPLVSPPRSLRCTTIPHPHQLRGAFTWDDRTWDPTEPRFANLY